MAVFKSLNTLFLLLAVLGTAGGFLSQQVFAQSACEALQCDCTALPKDEWKSVCKARELAMISQCKEGASSDALYCTAAGPDANHLALSLHLSEVQVLPTKQLPGLYKQVAAIYWSMRKDLQSVEEDIDRASFESAQGKLELVSRNVDTLFKIQQQITVSWLAYEDDKEAEKSWGDFASDSLDMGSALNKTGKKIWALSNKLALPESGNVKAMGLKLVEDSGKVFEHAAYAYSGAKQHDNSARTWEKAADASRFLIEVNSVVGADAQYLRRLTYQRAARIYRASYHWVKGKREGEAKNSLKKAQEVFDGANTAVTG